MSKSIGPPHTVIIGAGIGGLTTGALLLAAGHRVTILEAHIYPGGCAGTFFHQGYRFDAGATLAGGFAPGGPHARISNILGIEWPVEPIDPAWLVHMPEGTTISQWSAQDAWIEERERAFPGRERFWRIQEQLADASWDISSRPFPWPPTNSGDLLTLAQALRPSTARLLPYLRRRVIDLLPQEDRRFKTFLDGQLLISAQTTSDFANAVYGSAALDLPRRGVNAVRGGIGSLADTLAAWIIENGGEIRYRQRATKIEVVQNTALSVQTDRGQRIEGDHIVANLTPSALVVLLGEGAPAELRGQIKEDHLSWGAFTLYLGLEADKVNLDGSNHHQVILSYDHPLGEGNSVFISLSEQGDGRAPDGKLAATLSTHTAVAPWWELHEKDRAGYLAKRQEYSEKMIAAAEHALPGTGQAISLCLPGTPVTFQYYTGRPLGMVGGFPQTSLFNVRGPKTGLSNVWMVGDSIFPGQSTAGVTLGALRVAADIQNSYESS